MPAVPRDLQIVYNGFTIGGSTDRLIDSYTRLMDGYEEASFEVSFIVTASSDAAFASACSAAETAFRVPRADLVVTQGGQTLKSLKQSDNTGLDCDVKIVKQEHLVDTGRSRRYTVRFEFGRPADNVGTNGLRESSTLVQYGPQRRRRVTVAGVWTAVPPSGTSLANYIAGIDAFAVSQLLVVEPGTGVSIFWEIVDEPRVEFNSTNKIMEFSRTYQEKIYPDAGKSAAAPDDADLVDQVFEAAWVAEGNNDSPGSGVDHSGGQGTGQSGWAGPQGNTTGGTSDVTQVMQPTNTPTANGGASTARLGRVVCVYDAAVDKTRTTDLVGKYNSVIRGWMISEAQKVVAAGYGTMALMHESPSFDRDNNHIHAEMEFWVQGPAHTVEQKITTRDSTPTYGWVLVAKWDGDPMSKYKYRGVMQKLRIVSETRTVLGAATAQDRGKEPESTNNSIPVSRDVDETKRTLGLPGNQFDVTDIVITTIIEFYNGGSGAATGSPAANPGPGAVATPTPGTNYFPVASGP